MRHTPSSTLKWLAGDSKDVIFYSLYWFVPNFLLSLGILLLCKRYLPRWSFGFVLLLVCLFYAVNLYTHWTPAEHTRAFAAFTFYQSLGVKAATRREPVLRFLYKRS